MNFPYLSAKIWFLLVEVSWNDSEVEATTFSFEVQIIVS